MSTQDRFKMKSLGVFLFLVDDIVLVDETRCGINVKLESWKDAFEFKGFPLNMTKTEYMKCNFSKRIKKNKGILRLGGEEIPKS
jgi:hypothetical protein